MYWYVLQIQQSYGTRICSYLNTFDDILAVSPCMELWLKKEEHIEIKPMFPGYMLVLSHLDQKSFDSFLFSLKDKKGIVRELKKSNVQALRDDEITLLENLLDKDFILRLSYGTYINKHSVPYKGPLVKYALNIKRVDFSANKAILDLDVFDREISCGFVVRK